MVHWGCARTLPTLDHICHKDGSRACKWHSGVLPTTMPITVIIIKIPCNESSHWYHQCDQEPITSITLPGTRNWRFKSTRNVSRKFQKIYSSTGNRWHISEGAHQGEGPVEGEKNKGWVDTDKATPPHSHVPNTTLINGRQSHFNGGGIHRRSIGTEHLELSKTWNHRFYCPPRHRKKYGIQTSNKKPRHKINMDKISGKWVWNFDGGIEKRNHRYTDDENDAPERYHLRQKGYICPICARL